MDVFSEAAAESNDLAGVDRGRRVEPLRDKLALALDLGSVPIVVEKTKNPHVVLIGVRLATYHDHKGL